MTARFDTAGVAAFYPIVPVADEVVALLDLGVRTVQLRCKDPARAPAEIARAVAAGRAVPGAQVVINDHWREAAQAGAAWIHLGQEDLDDADLAMIAASGAGLGVSSHSPGERRRAVGVGADYVALGPVFETALKRMKFAPQGLGRVTAWARAVDVPVVAIGGISLDDVPSLRAAGASSLAVVSAIRTPDGASLDPERVRAWCAALTLEPA